MKRAGRRLFNFAAMVSAVALLILPFVWVRVWDKVDSLSWVWRSVAPNGDISLRSCNLQIAREGYEIIFHLRRGDANYFAEQHQSTEPGLFWSSQKNAMFGNGFGFVPYYINRSGGVLGKKYWTLGIQIPHWAVLSLAALLLTAWCVVAYRRKVRLRRICGACCAECGYDLRATPDRCPECGTVAQVIAQGDLK